MLLARNPLPADLLARIADLEPKPPKREFNYQERRSRIESILAKPANTCNWREARIRELLAIARERAAHDDLA